MNKTKKIYSAIYIVSRALFFVSAFALFFALLPPAEENGRRAAHYTIFAVCVLTGAALTVWGTEMKRRGLKNGVSPETFTPAGAQTAVSYFRLILMAVVIVFPFYVIVVTSLKTDYEAASLGFSWLPKLGASAEAYKYVFTSDTLDVTIGDALINTLKTSVVPTLASVFVSALSAYSFAKLEFRGKNALFGVLLLTMMTPGCTRFYPAIFCTTRSAGRIRFCRWWFPRFSGRRASCFSCANISRESPTTFWAARGLTGWTIWGSFSALSCRFPYPPWWRSWF